MIGIGQTVYQFKEYKVIDSNRGHIIINTKGEYDNHAHVKRLTTCKKVLNMIERHIVPDSTYLRGTALRLSLDEKYIDKINIKIEKDKQKQGYININKGIGR